MTDAKRKRRDARRLEAERDEAAFRLDVRQRVAAAGVRESWQPDLVAVIVADARIRALRGETVDLAAIVSQRVAGVAPAVARPKAPPERSTMTVEDEKAARDAYHARLRELGIEP
jgi:hypothetical protein